MIIRAERRSVSYFVVQDEKDLATAVMIVLRNHATVIAEDVGGTTFKEVFTIPDLRPLTDRCLENGETVQ